MWQPREPPLIVVDASFILDRWRPADGPALRRFDLDPDTARFFGYSVEQAAAMPDSHYDGDTRVRGNLQAWRERRQLNLAIRRSPHGEAVGWVELQQAGEQADVSYNVTAELRGQGIAPPRAQRAPRLGCEPNRSAPCPPRLSRRQRGFPAGRGKVRVRLG
jgi:RimJ/RimL family protein N-acetyltransferase